MNLENKIKVLEVIDSLGSGGAESLLKNFVLEAKKNKLFKIEITTLYSNAIFKEEIRGADIPVWDLNLKYKYDLRGIIKLITIIKRRKYNIVHVHLFPANAFAALASLFLHKDIVWIFSEHSVCNRRRSFKIFKILDNFTYGRYSKIICVSKQVQSTLLSWIPSIRRKVEVIPNAVPVPKFLSSNSLKIYDILFVGRLTQAKGVEILLKAVKIMKNKYNTNLKIAIVGGGPLKENLNNLAVELGVKGEVEFLGVRKDIEELMISSKIFVLPSRWEGLPMVILEAMSRGMSIIATGVGGIPEVIENGKEGILISLENPEALAKSINQLLNDAQMRKKLAKNAYKKIKEEYSIDKYVSSLINLYKKLLR